MEGSVGQITNIKPAVVGVVIPPDKLNRPVIYSHKEASRNIKDAQKDVYQMTKKISFEDRYKTPSSVFWAIGAAALALLFPYAKKLIKK